MKKILCLIAFICMATNVAAQTTYSFAGLSWGDSIQTVDSKLKAAGFSGCAMHEKMFCKAATTCRCQIKGPAVQEGWAELTNGQLEQVFVTVHDWSESVDVLTKKYGPAISHPPTPNTGKHSAFGSTNLDSRWRAPTGETLELVQSHRYLTYKSGARNRTATSQEQAKKSVF